MRIRAWRSCHPSVFERVGGSIVRDMQRGRPTDFAIPMPKFPATARSLQYSDVIPEAAEGGYPGPMYPGVSGQSPAQDT